MSTRKLNLEINAERAYLLAIFTKEDTCTLAGIFYAISFSIPKFMGMFLLRW